VINPYHRDLSPEEVTAGAHRERVGGLWDDLGKLQFDFLVAEGLEPRMRFLDIGCGCFRGGVHFIRYLDEGNYYGIDANRSLLDAGCDIELPRHGLKERLPRDRVIHDADFRFDRFSATFDFALALSVFTHLPLNHVRLCLTRLAPCMKVGGAFYATFFECPEREGWKHDRQFPDGVVTHPASDPYHYCVDDLRWCARGLPWRVEYIGAWNHPRGQNMIRFVRTEDFPVNGNE